MSRDRGKVSKNQQKRHVGQGKLPGVSQSYALDFYTNSKKYSVGFLMFFFSINEELRRVLLTSISMENFFPNSGCQVCSRKTCLTMCQYNFPREKKNRRGGGTF